MNATESFRQAVQRVGLDYAGPIVADGVLHHFRVRGDHDRNSWYVLHADHPICGVFGCWKRGCKQTWHQANGALSQADRDAVRRRWAAAVQEAERERTERQAKARVVAAEVWGKAAPAEGNAYLAWKGVQPHGDLRQSGGRLIVPLRDAAGTLHSLQFIGPDGAKRFLPGGRVAGCYCTLAETSVVSLK